MTDFTAPSSMDAVEALRDARTRTNLLKYAAWYATPAVGAEDLLSEAMLVVCDPEGRPWDKARASFSAHMRMVIRDVGMSERRRAVNRLVVNDLAAADAVLSPGLQPDDLLAEARQRERLSRLGAALRARIAQNERTLAVFDLACEGVEGAEQMATRIGCTVGEVYDCNRQLAYHAARVLEDERAADEARMKALRGGAKKGWLS